MLSPPAPITDVRTDTSARTLPDILGGAFRHWRVALGILVGATLAGILAALLIPPTYRAEARLLTLNAGLYDMQAENGAANTAQSMNPTDVANVEIQLLESAELHRAVARRELGAGASGQAIGERAVALEKALHVTKVTDANVIELTYLDRDPIVAARTLQAVIDGYFAARAEVLTSGRLGFLSSQLAKTQVQLDAIDGQIVAVQRQNNVVDIAAQVAGAVQQSNDLAKARLDAEAAVADGRRNIDALRRGASTIPRDVELYSDNTEAARSIGDMQTSLLQLRARRADFASRYMAESPQVQQLDKQIAGLSGAIARQRRDLVTTRRMGRNQTYDTARDRIVQVEGTAAGSAARAGVLNAQEQASRARLAQLIGVSDTLSRLKLQHDILTDAVRAVAARVELARIQQNQAASATGTNVRVVQAPVAPNRRSNPPLLFVAAGVVAGLALAGIALVVLAGLRTTFLSAGEATRALDMPILPIGRSQTAQARAYDELAMTVDGWRDAGATLLLAAPSSSSDLQQAAIGLGLALSRRTPDRVILVRFADGSPVPTPGSPDSATLSIQRWRGVATTTIGREASARGETAAALFEQLRYRYDHIVVTTPPAAIGTDASTLAAVADAVVLVLGADRTNATAASALADTMRGRGAHVIGAVLLDVRTYLPRWLGRRLGVGTDG